MAFTRLVLIALSKAIAEAGRAARVFWASRRSAALRLFHFARIASGIAASSYIARPRRAAPRRASSPNRVCNTGDNSLSWALSSVSRFFNRAGAGNLALVSDSRSFASCIGSPKAAAMLAAPACNRASLVLSIAAIAVAHFSGRPRLRRPLNPSLTPSSSAGSWALFEAASSLMVLASNSFSGLPEVVAIRRAVKFTSWGILPSTASLMASAGFWAATGSKAYQYSNGRLWSPPSSPWASNRASRTVRFSTGSFCRPVAMERRTTADWAERVSSRCVIA